MSSDQTRPSFRERLLDQFSRGRVACAGLDPVTGEMPPTLREESGDEAALWKRFLCELVDGAAAEAAAFKPNWAFFLALGVPGLEVLAHVCRHIRAVAPDASLVLDMKVGDIESTNRGYCRYAFEHLDVDAITLHPYLGERALGPFLGDERRGAFILCRTSNPGADEFQGLRVEGEGPLFMSVARAVESRWNVRGNCGLVVGATRPEHLREIRSATPALPLLIPGLGAQGGDLKATLQALRGGSPGGPYLLNVSRSFMYASRGADYAEAGAAELARINEAFRGVGVDGC